MTGSGEESEMTVGSGTIAPDFVRLHAGRQPDAAALLDAETGKTLSYRSLDRGVAATVTLLRKRGVGPRDRVAVIARNSVEQIILQLACARAGAILVALNWRLTAVELRALLDDCEPALVIGDELVQKAGLANLPTLTLAEVARGIEEEEPAPLEKMDAQRPSLMLYTSGTSGRPKGVVLSEGNLFASAFNFSLLGEVTSTSRFLADSPMFHIMGMVTNIRPALMMGGAVVVSSGFEAAKTLARIGDPRLAITHYFCVPNMAEMLRALPEFDPERLRGLKALFIGGAPYAAAHIRQWLAEGIAVVNGYGMTEAGTVLGMPLSRPSVERRPESAGVMAPTMERRIVNQDGEDVHAGEVGELLLRGPNVCASYWRNPQETADAFSEDGYLRTGDLVREDEEGYYYLAGRKKDMFISGGENVYPAEVEGVLAAHPAVAEAAVLGLPNPRWGEVGHAFIVLKPGAGEDEVSIRAFCDLSLARYKQPRSIRFVPSLPRTGSGKVAKNELRTLVDATRSAKRDEHRQQIGTGATDAAAMQERERER